MKTFTYRHLITMILICASLPVLGQQNENELISGGGTRMLVLTNGTFYNGRLLRIFKEGVLFDPEVELDFDNPPPTFFPFATVLLIRDMDGHSYSNHQLELLAEQSIRDYNLPDEIKYYKWKNIAYPYYINFEFGLSRNPVDDRTSPTYLGNYSFKVDYSTMDLSLDLSYRLCTWFDMGFRLDYKRYNIHLKGLDTPEPDQTINNNTNFGLDHIRIFSPFCPILKINRGGHKWRVSGAGIFGQTYVRELPRNKNRPPRVDGHYYGGLLSLDYRMTERTSLGLEYNYYRYHFKDPQLADSFFDYENMTINSFKLSIKHYFNW